MESTKRVLVVGAGGFIGGYLVAEALRRGYETWCGVRATTSRRRLTDERLRFVTLDFDRPETLAATLRDALPQGERWDYIVFNLGATKCLSFTEFNQANYMSLRNFIEALRQSDMMPRKLLYMSSLSAVGKGDERHYTPMTETMVPNPDTRYGLSKIKAETLLEMSPDVPWIIFRPTGVYGSEPNDYMMMLSCIDAGFDFGIGYRRQMLTFIEARDLARAVMDALASETALRHKYIISEPRAYTQKEFRTLAKKALGRRIVIPVRLPLWAAYVASFVAEKIGIARMRPSTLNRDKFKIMKQRNWSCDVSAAQRDFGFTAGISLQQGLDEAARAYRQQKKNKKHKS